MTSPRALLLDLDNTIYPYQPCHEAGLEVAQAHAVRWHLSWESRATFRADYDRARRQVKQQVGRAAAAHCRLLYFKAMTENRLGKTSISAAVALHDAYWQGYAQSMRLDPHCAVVLRQVRAADVKLAWVTNFTTARQLWKLERLGLADTADFLVTSEEAGGEKPDPATLRLALERLDVAPADAWLVGDSLVDDAGAAAAAGVTFVWFRRDDHEIPTPSPQTISDWPTLRELLHVRLGTPSS